MSGRDPSQFEEFSSQETPSGTMDDSASVSENSIENSIDQLIQQCIGMYYECFQSCTKQIHECLKMGGEHASPEHIGLLAVCADVCHLAAKAMDLQSEFDEKICKLCADICQRCAEDCRALAKSDDKDMLECADICESCADMCRQMTRH